MQQAKRILLIGLGRWVANHLAGFAVANRLNFRLPSVMRIDLDSSGVSQSLIEPQTRILSFPVIVRRVRRTPAATHFEMLPGFVGSRQRRFREKPISLRSAHAKDFE